MKILFVTDLYPIENEKVAKALFYFVQEWKNQGHYIEVIRSNFIFNSLIRGRKIKKEKILYEEGIKIYNLNFYSPFLFNIYNKLPKDFLLKNYDVIISHMPCGALLANKLLKKDKIKYICSVHCSDIHVLTDKKYSIYFKNQLKKAYLAADKISARSPLLKSKIEKLIPEIENKTFIAYSGIENNIISNDLTEKSNNKDTLNITTAASLIKRKNINIILKALSQLNINYKFKIIGEGPEYNNLRNLVKKLNIKDKVIFTGRINRENVIKELNNSDLFILLSRNETFGISYLEAMATGNLIIAKKNDGIDGILKHEENAFLIDSNITELKNCIERIMKLNENQIKEIQQNMFKTIKEYTIEKASANYIENIK